MAPHKDEALGFRSPMLATAATSLPAGNWVAEEKHDGWRIITSIDPVGNIRMWTRTGKSFPVLKQFVEPLSKLKPQSGLVILDGEAKIPHGTSTDLADLSKRHKAVYVVFDILHRELFDTTGLPWQTRRARLEETMSQIPNVQEQGWVQLASHTPVKSWEEVQALAERVWVQSGEGLILKDTTAPYFVGKRRRVFLKIKDVQPAVLRIIGFAPSEGEVMQYGDYGTAVLQDDDGIIVPVKVLDDEVRARLKKDESVPRDEWHWMEERLPGSNKKIVFHTSHSWVGTYLHIEYTVRTEHSYRHPRWDRREGE